MHDNCVFPNTIITIKVLKTSSGSVSTWELSSKFTSVRNSCKIQPSQTHIHTMKRAEKNEPKSQIGSGTTLWAFLVYQHCAFK